jgi:GH25 family lysozyme M1 (1,4-beta-N-acetylmuramidase)
MKGIDISTWNKQLNYDEVARNIDFVIIRVGYGVSYLPNEQRDELFDSHYNGLKGKTLLGAYYYAYGKSYADGVKEAENCLAYMGDKKFELPIYYDMEEKKNTKEAGQGFVDRIRQAGLKCGIYASTSFYKNKELADINCDSVWIAQYGSNSGNVPTDEPSVRYDIWQYTSKGYVTGVEGRVDVNIAKDEIGENITAPAKQEEPAPVQEKKKGDVKDVQKWLNNRYDSGLAVDGIYGPKTKEALVKALQTELNRMYGSNLNVDGIFGPKTKKAIVAYRRGSAGNIVRVIQGLLICNGYNIALDGDFGPDTEAAAEDYQRTHPRLVVDKIVGKNTFERLCQ